MTMFNDLAALESLTDLTLDRVRNIHEWKIVESCRCLLSLDIRSPIDFQLQTDIRSQLCRTLEMLFISFDCAAIQHVRLTFAKLDYLSLKITSNERGNTDINEAVNLFMQANFVTGINKSLTSLVLYQDSSFDLMLITMFNFPALTYMRLEISDPYNRGRDEKFCEEFYDRICTRVECLQTLNFVFKCSQRRLGFQFD
ncbi:hypothetical protein VCUG_02717 [Vavraia culicis subsp. floridensis]|uniref:F-box domain-containing protein n=1 Tax=Vavraia culicis (isolate floridensis) TaxID=948595 RepID=L2GQ46_VAVCU|nr:uncharacterized protein VCUG_02717 [Vavraia culicis subsp. floridensis]ELA45796.2 hypothetical protein VCUG_02717 [Vavraia culicis subsp. floridensis]